VGYDRFSARQPFPAVYSAWSSSSTEKAARYEKELREFELMMIKGYGLTGAKTMKGGKKRKIAPPEVNKARLTVTIYTLNVFKTTR